MNNVKMCYKCLVCLHGLLNLNGKTNCHRFSSFLCDVEKPFKYPRSPKRITRARKAYFDEFSGKFME